MDEDQTPTAETKLPVDSTLITIESLHSLTPIQLQERLTALNARVKSERSRRHLVFDLLKAYAAKQIPIHVEGILELSNGNNGSNGGGHGVLRWPRYNFREGPDDVSVLTASIRDYALRNGNRVAGTIRQVGS